jgi:hypothetical protein
MDAIETIADTGPDGFDITHPTIREDETGLTEERTSLKGGEGDTMVVAYLSERGEVSHEVRV